MPNPADVDRWRRTSPFAIVHFVWTTARGFADGWGRLATTFGITAVLLRYRGYLAPGIAIGILALVAVAVLRWLLFRFRIAEDRILIREGLLNRTALDIPFDRIQGINVNRRLVERAVGLVTVVVDTPGTLAAEGRLPSVHPEVADQLLRRVEAHRNPGAADEPVAETGIDKVGDEASAPSGEVGAGIHPKRVQPRARILQKLSVGDLVRFGLANPPVLLLAFLPVAFGVRLDDWLMTVLGVLDTVRNAVGGDGILGTIVTAAVFGLGVLILGLAAGIVHRVVLLV